MSQDVSLPRALWSAGFRPFYLAGCGWGLLAVLLWAVGHYGGVTLRLALPVWHGHEMIFGFAGALCGGFILTALPSWAGAPAIHGRPLALLLAAWGIGRVAILFNLPPALAAAADLAYLPLLTAMIWPGVWAAKNRLYRVLPLILAVLIAGNLVFHFGPPRFGLRVGIYGLMLLFSFVVGLLTPIFTETEANLPARFNRLIEVLAPSSLVLVAVVDLAGLAPPLLAAAALAAVLVHGVRMAGWPTRAVLRMPLLLTLHIGYGWLLVSLACRAAAALDLGALGAGLPAAAAVHAFTVGALGLTKLSLMTRVALKHTGRPLAVPPAMLAAFAAMSVAALARLTAEAGLWPAPLLVLSALAWLTAIVTYLAVYGLVLLRPSLPRRTTPPPPSPQSPAWRLPRSGP